MIFQTLCKYRYVRQYKRKQNIKYSTIESLLRQTWKVTPSKNNFMPYEVHVCGPLHQYYKNCTYLKCLKNEGQTDNLGDPASIRYHERMPNYANILTCPYLLIFTLRVEEKPNPFQKWLMEEGHVYPATSGDTIRQCWSNANIEVGMFANTLKTLCLAKHIDVAFIGCFPSELEEWEDLPFIKREPILLMTLGHGKVYRQDVLDEMENQDYKPNFEKVVNFIGDDQ